ncbi:GyrI-like domain-containing protein [Paenibacillus kobensis]|uniref:GyrI-like domain-containing protein n=1 Tax=Paenibacillus kobensis TaxID=59841 RepID=UPI0013E3B6DF|nr:effector binding domain-containing protein [Paenibacillus kobensis]
MSETTQTAGKASGVTREMREEMKFIGIPVIVSFKDGDYSTIERTKKLFMERRVEIEGVIDPDMMWAPWYANDIMFTYIYAVQVAELVNVPAGMIGFTQPAAEYAVVAYDGPLPWNPDPYHLLYEYRQSEGLEQNDRLMVLEKYRFDLEAEPNGQISIQVWGPLKS